MKNYIIICGLNDKDTRKQEITTEQAKTTLATIILDYADGATLTECNGIYKHEDGGIVFEKSIKIEISGISKENALTSRGGLRRNKPGARVCRRITLKIYSNMEVLHYDTLHNHPKGRKIRGFLRFCRYPERIQTRGRITMQRLHNSPRKSLLSQ